MSTLFSFSSRHWKIELPQLAPPEDLEEGVNAEEEVGDGRALEGDEGHHELAVAVRVEDVVDLLDGLATKEEI